MLPCFFSTNSWEVRPLYQKGNDTDSRPTWSRRGSEHVFFLIFPHTALLIRLQVQLMSILSPSFLLLVNSLGQRSLQSVSPYWDTVIKTKIWEDPPHPPSNLSLTLNFCPVESSHLCNSCTSFQKNNKHLFPFECLCWNNFKYRKNKNYSWGSQDVDSSDLETL